MPYGVELTRVGLYMLQQIAQDSNMYPTGGLHNSTPSVLCITYLASSMPVTHYKHQTQTVRMHVRN